MGGEHFVLAWVDHAIVDLSEETFWYGCRVNPLKQICLRIGYVVAMFRSDRVDFSAKSFGVNPVRKDLTSKRELRPCGDYNMPLSFSFVAASLRPVYCTSFAQGERHPQTHHVIRASCSMFLGQMTATRTLRSSCNSELPMERDYQ